MDIRVEIAKEINLDECERFNYKHDIVKELEQILNKE